MTSRSRTKPRTTPRNTRSRGNDIGGLTLAVWLLAAVALPARDWRTLVGDPADMPAVRAVSAEVPPATNQTLDSSDTEEPAKPAAAGATPAAPDAAADPALELPAAADAACGENTAECRAALQKLRDDPLAGIELDIKVGGRPGSDYPCECRLTGETFKPRRFAATTFTWKAAGYCHKPLYFEDWRLERYGHSHGFVADSFTSAAHFFVTLPVLPYKMGVELPWECVYPLGYYRPGNCAPWTVPAVPISIRGFAVEAATITGIVFLLP